jgi:hypothetical protein
MVLPVIFIVFYLCSTILELPTLPWEVGIFLCCSRRDVLQQVNHGVEGAANAISD